MGRNNADFLGYDIVHKNTREPHELRTLAIHRETSKVIGELRWEDDPDDAPKVLYMDVHPKFQQLGIMSALVTAASKHTGQVLDVPGSVSNDGEVFTKKAVKRGLLNLPPYGYTINGETGEEVHYG